MKSILQNIVLLSSILLIASCDSGTGSGVADIGVSTPTPSNGVSGTIMKGPVSGATITVTDATGADVPIASGSTTNTDGSFSLVFTQAAIAAGITPPLTVTADVGGKTATCDIDVDGTDNDCPVGDGTFAKFGDTYTLEAGLTLSGTIATVPADTPTSDPVVIINVNPASDLATSLAQASASGSALTAGEVSTANQQVLGLIQAITGVDMSGLDLVDIPGVDIANLDATSSAGVSDASYAMAAFSAAILAEIDGTTITNVAQAIARLKSELSVDSNGNLTGTGTNLGRLASNIAKALHTVNARITAAGSTNARLAGATETAQRVASNYSNFGNNDVSVPPPAQPGSTAPLDQTKAFIAKLSDVISSAVATTGAAGFGGPTYQGATEVFATELDSANRMSGTAAAHAIEQAMTALIDAEAQLEPGTSTVDTDATDDGLTGTIEKSADGLTTTVTDGVSTYTANGITATLTIPNGSRVKDASFEAKASADAETPQPGITLTITDSEGTTLETFTGDLAVTFAEESNNVGMKTFSLTGNVAGQTEGTGFGVDLSATDLTGVTSADSNGGMVTGNYSVTLSFTSASADDLSVTVSGPIGSAVQSYTVTAGTSTLMGTVTRDGSTDVDTITDGVATLTLTLDLSQGSLTSGVLSVGEGDALVQTGTVDSNGVVTYSDGSIQSLPAAVF